MAISDAVVGNLTTLFLVVIAAMKAYGLATGRSFSSSCVLVLSTTVVALILIATLTWDVSRKALIPRNRRHKTCRGGICWPFVSVKTPAFEIRPRFPRHQNH